MVGALAQRTRGGLVLRRHWRWRDAPSIAFAGGAAYFVVVALALLWSWGSPQPDEFNNPDESTNRLAALLVAETGSPVLVQPFEDAEDLVHLRSWYSIDGEARPAYPPLTYYVYGYGLRVGGPGEWLPLLAAAVGVGALAAAGALTLSRRPWLGLLLPLLAFPFTFWVMRPWHNAGLAYAFLSVAVLLFVLWARSRRQRLFVASALLLALAGATRPDLLLYLFGACYLIALYLELASWKRITLTLAASGLVAVALIALFNWAVVGDPLQAGYQELAGQPNWGGYSEARDGLPTPFQELAWAIAPWGIQPGRALAAHVAKLAFALGPVAPLTVGAVVGYEALLRRSPRGWLLATLVALGALLTLFVTTRYCSDCFGADEPLPALGHSNPRYAAGAYLLAAFSAFTLLAASQRRLWLDRIAVGSLIAVAASMVLVLGVYLEGERGLREEYRRDAQMAAQTLPEGTVLYARFGDLYLWNVPGIISAHLPPEFPRDPLAPPEPVPAEAFERLARSVQSSYDSRRPTALTDLHQDYIAVIESLLSPELRLVPVQHFEHTWLVEARAGPAMPPDGGRGDGG